MRKLFTLPLALLALVLVPGSALAQTTPTTTTTTTTQNTTVSTPAQKDLRHAYNPNLVNQNQWLRARINNTTGQSQNKLVCVEGWATSNNMKTHLGCLTIPWDHTNNWSQEFDAPLSMLGSGSHKVQYTYQRSDGTWHNVTDMNGNNVAPTVTR